MLPQIQHQETAHGSSMSEVHTIDKVFIYTWCHLAFPTLRACTIPTLRPFSIAQLLTSDLSMAKFSFPIISVNLFSIRSLPNIILHFSSLFLIASNYGFVCEIIVSASSIFSLKYKVLFQHKIFIDYLKISHHTLWSPHFPVFPRPPVSHSCDFPPTTTTTTKHKMQVQFVLFVGAICRLTGAWSNSVLGLPLK